MVEALRRADGLQSSVDALQAKCREFESQLQAVKHENEEAEKHAAARELQAKRQAESDASHMHRQLSSKHEAAVQALQQQLKDESAAAAAERVAHASALRELESCHATHTAALLEKERVISNKESEISEAEARIQSLKQRLQDESVAAASLHAQALRTQEAAHTASVEALQATYDLQLRQLRATSQGAIESVGKSQDALTLVRFDSIDVRLFLSLCVSVKYCNNLRPLEQVLDSRLADLQRHHREEMAQVVGSHSRQIQQVRVMSAALLCSAFA
jgi:chromosome segregation ATPase